MALAGSCFTTDNSINDILSQAGPEAGLYIPGGKLEVFPEELRERPLKEWAGDFRMPKGNLFPYEEFLCDVNDMVLNGDKNLEKIPLWDEEGFTIHTNDIHSVCLMKLKDEEAPDDYRSPVIVVPGGRYEFIAFHNEGFETARRLEKAGYRAFILNYRCKPNTYPDPQLDLAMAVLHIRANAEKYKVDPDDLMLMGYSAGGHLCASLAALHDEIAAELEKHAYTLPSEISLRPDKVCLCYPVISFVSETHEPSFQALAGGNEKLREHLSIEKEVGEDFPPAFVWACADDSTVPCSNAVRMAEALQQKGNPCMLRIYPYGEHGCSVGDGTSAEGWMEEMATFMKEQPKLPRETFHRDVFLI